MRKFLVAVVVAGLAAPASSLAPTEGSLAGQIVGRDGAPPPSAVWIATTASADRPERAPVDNAGAFRFDGLPEGTVRLAVETAEGLYEVGTPLTIAPGTTRQVQLALWGRQDTSAPAETPKKKKKKTGVWGNPLTATLIVVGSAIVVGLLIDQLTSDNGGGIPASPSNSNQ